MKITKKQFRQILIKELEDAFSMFDDPDWLGRAKVDTIPILKPSKENPDEQPLRAELEKAGLPKNVINTIVRSIVKQLKASDIKVTESKLHQAIEDVLLEKMQKVSSRRDVKKLQNAGLRPGGVLKRGKSWFADDGAEVRKYSDEQQAQKWARSLQQKAPPVKKGPPKDWLTQGGTREEWDALTTKERFVFMKMPKNKKSKYFKMSSEQRMELYKQMKLAGPKSKSDIGAKKTAAAQAAAGEKAVKDSKPKAGEIKISSLNQQLRTISPPANDRVRKIALNVVQKYLKPYLKKHGLKLSEEKLFADVVDIILEAKKLKNKVN